MLQEKDKIGNDIARERKMAIKAIARSTRKMTTKIARLVDCKRKENKRNNVILIILDRNKILF